VDADEEGDQEHVADVAVFFDVTCAKGSQSLVFECVTDGVAVDILRCELRGAEGAAEAYTGPEFDTLEEGLQEAFAEYLHERGVDSLLAEYLVDLSCDKEQREYTNWLKATAAFVAK